jgi:hypothetical protein
MIIPRSRAQQGSAVIKTPWPKKGAYNKSNAWDGMTDEPERVKDLKRRGGEDKR